MSDTTGMGVNGDEEFHAYLIISLETRTMVISPLMDWQGVTSQLLDICYVVELQSATYYSLVLYIYIYIY